MLAAIFRIMALIAGLSAGSVGKSSRMTGLTARPRLAIRPASEATRMRPRKNAITPTSPMARSTALRADDTTASVSDCISPVTAAARTEVSTTKTKMPLSMKL